MVDCLDVVLLYRHKLHQPADILGDLTDDCEPVSSEPHRYRENSKCLSNLLCADMAFRRISSRYHRRPIGTCSCGTTLVSRQHPDKLCPLSLQLFRLSLLAWDWRRLQLARGKQDGRRVVSE